MKGYFRLRELDGKLALIPIENGIRYQLNDFELKKGVSIMSNIINWPESQVCIGCVNGLLIMSSEPSQYICDLGYCGGSKCEDRAYLTVVLHPAGYWWTCPLCDEVNEIGNEEYLKIGDTAQCNNCLEEFKYE